MINIAFWSPYNLIAKKIYEKYIILSAFFFLLHLHSYDVCRRRCIWAFAWFVGSDVVTQLCQISWRFSTFAKFFAFALIWSTLSSKIIRVGCSMFPISLFIYKKDKKFLQEKFWKRGYLEISEKHCSLRLILKIKWSNTWRIWTSSVFLDPKNLDDSLSETDNHRIF